MTDEATNDDAALQMQKLFDEQETSSAEETRPERRVKRRKKVRPVERESPDIEKEDPSGIPAIYLSESQLEDAAKNLMRAMAELQQVDAAYNYVCSKEVDEHPERMDLRIAVRTAGDQQFLVSLPMGSWSEEFKALTLDAVKSSLDAQWRKAQKMVSRTSSVVDAYYAPPS